jgi:hypothetical protein
MCGNPFKAPSLPAPPPLPEAPKAVEAVKQVTQEQTRARDRTLQKMAARLSLANTNKTGGLGVAGTAATTTKTLLGQ